MAIIRCNNCSYLREVPNEYAGKTVKCPTCEEAAPIHDTLTFLRSVLEKYSALLAKHREMKKLVPSNTENETTKNVELDLHNTTAMTNIGQYKPVMQWFESKQIQIDVDLKALDTQGFFDEVAVELGANYDVLQDVLDRIKKTQKSGYTSVVLNIGKNSQKEMQLITGFCKRLYDYSFVAKYFYNKSEKRIYLTLQTAPTIVNFFNGEWLEWFVFMRLLKFFYEKNDLFSCLRSFTINFANEDKQEIDVFFLIKSRIPLFIECKSGEFRSMIDKYSKLRQRLDIDKEYFLLLVLGLSDEQARGLTSMYGVTFVNEKNFIDHISALLH